MKNLTFPTENEMKLIEPFILKRKKKNSQQLKKDGLQWTRTAWENKMDYEVTWLGIPIIQNPYDIVLMQELIFKLKPDVIVETGIAHGGSLIYYSSLLELLGNGRIIGIDVDIREHNRKLIEKHPLFKRITMIMGSSIDISVIKKIKKMIKPRNVVLILLDSDHQKKHVYAELNAYKDVVSKGSYMVVFDTFAHNLIGLKGEKPFFKKENAMEAIKLFVKENRGSFVVDKYYNKFFVSSCIDGFLKRAK